MKLEDARSAYEDFSGRASDIARTLALSGIALIWVFKVDSQNGPQVPQELVVPGIWLVVHLALDLTQYLYATIAWGLFHRWKEHWRPVAADKDFLAPRAINWPTNAFFYGKVVAVGIAYWYLLAYLLSRYQIA